MKAFILSMLFAVNSFAATDCSEVENVEAKDVVYKVNTDMPKHLKGATITVTLADGKSSTVPADKFMVVPRKQQTVVGQDKLVNKTVSCLTKDDARKNLVFVNAQKEYTGVETRTTAVPNGTQLAVDVKKEVVPGLNYYRRDIKDSRIGAGLGLDAKGQVNGMIGLDF